MDIQRNETICNNCMLCVMDCVSGAWRNNNGKPEMADPEACNLCSHCLAVCPVNAVTHNGLDSSQIKQTDTGLLISDAYYEIARGRRSIRHYKDKPVSDDLIQTIISLANYSPTASNKQNVEYIVITDKTVLKEISNTIFGFSTSIYYKTKKFPWNLIYTLIKHLAPESDLCRYVEPMQFYIDETEKGREYILHHAPALILIHAPKGKNFSNENCNISATNLMNYAHSLKLGTCYIGFLNVALKFSKKLRRRVQLPKDRMAYACIVLGYPTYSHKNTTARKLPDIEWIK